MEKTSTAFTQAFAGAPCKSQFALCSKWQICMGLHDQLHLRCLEQVHILVFCGIFAPASSCCVLFWVVVIVGDGGWWWWRWARQRLGRVMVLSAEACWWSPEIQKTLSEIKKKYSKLPKGSAVCFLEASIVGLDATSQASKHFACLSGGTPLALAAFVGDEVPKIRESRWCSWHQFLYGFIMLYCFWRLP